MSSSPFGRYKVVEEIGRGAMGVVYRATDPVIGRPVAIKVVNESYLTSVGVEPAEYFERFKREAEVAGRLNHRGIVKIYDLGPNFIVMEYIDGHNLAALLRASRKQHLSEALDIIGQVADALDHAHASGIVHRDVKPANILVQTDGTVKVMDFGLARIDSSTLTAAGEILGSASYMAPEIVRGHPATPRTDVFSLGVVAYELMTGDRPFAGASISAIIHSIVQTTPTPIHRANLNLPPAYDDIFSKVLAKEPADRYETAGAFARALVLKKWADRDPTLLEPLPEASPDSTTERDGTHIREVALAASRQSETRAAEAAEPAPPEATIVLPASMAAPAPPARQPPSGPITDGRAVPPRRPGLPWLGLGCGALVLVVLFGVVAVVAWRLLRPQTPGLAPLSTPAPASLPEEPVSTAPPPSEGPVAEASAPPSSAPALSRLTLTSEPQGARVLVGRRVQGVTPLDLQLPPGPASLVVEKAGFRPWRRSLQLAPGGEVSLNAVLEAEPMPERSPPSVAPPPPPSTAPKAAATKEGDLVALTPDVTPPKRLSGDAPVVSRSFSVRASTAVVIEFLVTEDGVVQDAKVVESGGAVLDKACLDALSKWRYAPATKEGVKVRVGQRARFVFQRR